MRSRIRDLEWSRRGARGLLVVIQVPLLMNGPLLAGLGGVSTIGPGVGWPPLLVGALILALTLRLSLQVARGARPEDGPRSALLIFLLTFVPMIWFPFGAWVGLIVAPISAAVLVLSGWRAVVSVAVMATPPVVWAVVSVVEMPQPSVDFIAYLVVNALPGYVVGVLAICGGVWLVRSLDELHATRAELAALAINRERLRLSRDLHDLLGQSLSAVALKADLAICLVDAGDLPGARVQTSELTGVAQRANAGLQDVTSGRDVVSLREELASAEALLRVAEIDARMVTGENLVLPPLIDTALAWSVREGITNVLRHSAARTAEVTVGRPDGLVRVEIVNDGVAGDRLGVGTGLRGLAGRVGELSGSLSAEFVDGGRFRLRVDIPLPV